LTARAILASGRAKVPPATAQDNAQKFLTDLFFDGDNEARFHNFPDTAMNDELNYKSNPLHGVGLKKLLQDIVDHYGFDVLHAYVNIKCFKTNPSIESSVKFLKKTDWAREIVENFYLYEFKSLPAASPEQRALSPRDRVIPDGQAPGKPTRLTLRDAERLCERREKTPGERQQHPYSRVVSGKRPEPQRSRHAEQRDEHRRHDGAAESARPAAPSPDGAFNPWGNRKK
jgi:uncharacterized protein (DUF2132 family)